MSAPVELPPLFEGQTFEERVAYHRQFTDAETAAQIATFEFGGQGDDQVIDSGQEAARE
jgi:hypothetical protein